MFNPTAVVAAAANRTGSGMKKMTAPPLSAAPDAEAALANRRSLNANRRSAPRQDLSGASPDGTITGRGGNVQRLGPAAMRRMASRPAAAPMPTAPSAPAPPLSDADRAAADVQVLSAAPSPSDVQALSAAMGAPPPGGGPGGPGGGAPMPGMVPGNEMVGRQASPFSPNLPPELMARIQQLKMGAGSPAGPGAGGSVVMGYPGAGGATPPTGGPMQPPGLDQFFRNQMQRGGGGQVYY